MSRKVTIKFSVEDPDIMFSRGGERIIECYGWTESLADDIVKAIELFELRNEKYKQDYWKNWKKYP